MFTSSSFAPQRAQQFAAAYRRVGTETAVDGADSHKLVAMLFDGFVEAIAQARGAMHTGQFEKKGRAIGRATGIVEEGLRGALDLRAGGRLAADLNDLYAYVSLRLTRANLNNDEAGLDECLRLLQPVREAWAAIAGARPAHG